MKVISAPLTINAASPATFTRAGTAWYFDYAGTLQSAGVDTIRFNWNKETAAFEGVMVENAATNLLLNTTSPLVTQTKLGMGVGSSYVLSFYGTGSVQLTAGVTGSPTLVGTGANKRVSLLFSPAASTVTFTVTGSVTYAQCELGLWASSVIPTAGTSVTRPADVVTGTGVFYNGFVDATQVYPAGSPYIIGEVVQYGGRLYESVVAQAPGPTPGTDPLAWLDTGPNNVTAAFDLRASTRSVGNGDEEVICIYSPTAVNAVGVMNMSNCNYLHCILRWATYVAPTTLYKSGYPKNALLTSSTAGRYITIVVNNAAGTPSYPQIGEIVLGTLADMGEGEYGFQWSLVDYSKVVDDGFGIITFTKGSNIKLLSGSTKVLTANYNTVTDLAAALTSVPTVYQFTDVAAYESGALTFAFMKNARMSPPGATYATLSVDLQGLT